MGLEIPGRRQASDPRLPGLAAPGLDMDAGECAALVDHVRSLPAPVATRPDDDKDSAQIKAGESTFKSIGCASCHLPKLGDAEGIFSDLLLHDMGPQLGDGDTYTVFSGEPPARDRPAVPDRPGAAVTASAPRVADAASLGTPRLGSLHARWPCDEDRPGRRATRRPGRRGGETVRGAFPPAQAARSRRSSRRSPPLPGTEERPLRSLNPC